MLSFLIQLRLIFYQKKIAFGNSGFSCSVLDTLVYLDPPYLLTLDNYSHSFKEQDCIDLFDCVQKIGVKFAYSEFDNPFILQQAKERNLNVITIGERQNLKNRRTEILVTNYQNTQLSLFDKP